MLINTLWLRATKPKLWENLQSKQSGFLREKMAVSGQEETEGDTKETGIQAARGAWMAQLSVIP